MERMKKTLLCLLAVAAVLVVTVLGNGVVNASSPKEKEKKTVTPEQLELWDKPDTEQMEFYGISVFETNLPVIYINTQGQKIGKENKIVGTIALGADDGQLHSVQETPQAVYRAKINYRGASSYGNLDKKQYRIKFLKNNSDGGRDVALCGMGKHSEWVLNGPYLDKTLVRNKLMYDLARETGHWAPDSRFCELFVDGEYHGVYLAIEPVTNGDTRLRLSKFGLLSGKTPYLVVRNRDSEVTAAITTYGKEMGYTGHSLYIDYPTSGKLTPRQENYIREDISAFERVLYGDNFLDELTGYRNWIDMDSWVDYFILNEFAMIRDAGNLSTYAYKKLDGKIQLAVWDFNNAFDHYQGYSLDSAGFITTSGYWLDRVCQDPVFVDRVVERYRQLRETTLSQEHIAALLAGYRSQLVDAVWRNFRIWGGSFQESILVGRDAEGNPRNIRSYQQAVEQLDTMISRRLAYLDAHITDLYDLCRKES